VTEASAVERVAHGMPASAKRWFADGATRWRWAYRAKVWYLGRRCDVFLLSYPKCGRTWLRLMIGRAVQPALGLRQRELLAFTNAAVRRPGVPRLLATHDDSPQVKTPEHVMTDKRGYRGRRVVLLVRDPRDVVVSLFFHRTRWRGDAYPGTVSEFVRERRGGLDTVLAFYNAWAAQRGLTDDLLIVRYEDLHTAAAAELARVLEFTGLDFVDADARERAVRLTTFERMQQIEGRNALHSRALRARDAGDPESFRVRRGVVGGHRDYLSDADIAWIDGRIERSLDPSYRY
jgi:hypothetical protein